MSCAAAASAVPIDSVGDSFAVSFDGSVKGVLTPGLTASASFLVTEFDGAAGRVVLQISLSNTTDTTLFKQARVSALGFDVDATLSGASASGLFGHALLGSQFPSQFGPVDVCAIGNPNSCSSGRNAGALLGQSGVVTLTLSFAGPLTALDLSNFGVRYQTLEPVGPFIEDSGTGHGTVPEPRVLALLGAAGLALFGRRRR
ncbi:MAG TPA: cistern family PEP-CTERM protein [Myxococcota bacterium]